MQVQSLFWYWALFFGHLTKLYLTLFFYCSDQNYKKQDLTNLLKNVLLALLHHHEAHKHERSTSGFVLLRPAEFSSQTEGFQSPAAHGTSLVGNQLEPITIHH